MQTIGNHQRLVEYEQVGDLGLVSFELVESCPDIALFSCRVLELDHRHRQAVDKAHHIWATRLFGSLHRVLVHHQKLVLLRLRKVDQAHAVATLHAVDHDLDRHAIDQQFVKAAIVQYQRWMTWFGQLVRHIIQHRSRDAGVQAL